MICLVIKKYFETDGAKSLFTTETDIDKLRHRGWSQINERREWFTELLMAKSQQTKNLISFNGMSKANNCRGDKLGITPYQMS